MKIDKLEFEFTNPELQAEWLTESARIEKAITAFEAYLAKPLTDNKTLIREALTHYMNIIHSLSFMRPKLERFLKVGLLERERYFRGEHFGEKIAVEMSQSDCFPIIYALGVVESVYKALKESKAMAKTLLDMEYNGGGG